MKRKIRQFIDYYLLQTVIVLACISVVVYFVKTIAFDRKDIALSVMVLNDSEDFNIDMFEAELKGYLGITDEKQDITFSLLRTDVPQNEAIILTRLRAKSVDIIIADEKTFRGYVSNGIYADLESLVDDEVIGQGQDKLVQGNIAILDRDGNIIGEEPAMTYGWNLADNEKYVTLGGIIENPVFGIVVNSMNSENAVGVLKYFQEEG